MSINLLQMNELEDIQEYVFQHSEDQVKQRFQITDLNSLNWAFRKLSAIEAKKAEINKLADAEIERIEAYRKREMEATQHSEDFFKSLIAAYAVKEREKDPKFKAKTPYGSVSFRKRQPKWHYNDEELLNFLEQNELTDLIRVKKEPVKPEIKKRFSINEDGRAFDENGQEVAGINVEFVPEEVVIKPEVE